MSKGERLACESRRLGFLFFLVLGISLLIKEKCFGQLMIDRAKIDAEISPQEVFSGKITVFNLSLQSMKVKVYPQDFLYVPPFDGRKEFFPPGTVPYSCANWIHIFPQRLEIPPKSKKEVTYSIRVPAEVKGGYYSVLFFETASGSIERKEVNLQIIQRVGCLFFLETKDKTKKAEVSKINIERQGMRIYFSNRGDTIIVGKGVFYLTSREGLVVERGEVDSFYLPPQKETSFFIELPENLNSGAYTVVITFDLQEGDVLVKEIDFLKEQEEIVLQAIR